MYKAVVHKYVGDRTTRVYIVFFILFRNDSSFIYFFFSDNELCYWRGRRVCAGSTPPPVPVRFPDQYQSDRLLPDVRNLQSGRRFITSVDAPISRLQLTVHTRYTHVTSHTHSSAFERFVSLNYSNNNF